MKIYTQTSISASPGSKPFRFYLSILLICVGLLVSSLTLLHAEIEKKPLTFQEMMKFKALRDAAFSEKGDIVAYTTQSDRGNPDVAVHNLTTKKVYIIPRGTKAIISKDSHWAAATVLPDALEMEKAEQKDKLKNGMAFIDTTNGKMTTIENVKSFSFSDNSLWLANTLFPEEKKDDKKDATKDEKKTAEEKKPAEEKKAIEEKKPEEKKPEEKKPEEKKKDADKDDDEKIEVSAIILRNMETGKEIRIEKVSNFLFDPASCFAAYTLFDKENPKQNGLYVRDLKNPDVEKKILCQPNSRFTTLTWSKKKSRLGFIYYDKPEEKKDKPDPFFTATLFVWDGGKDKLITVTPKDKLPTGWMVPYENTLTWTEDENRLFFGFKPEADYQWTHPKKTKPEPDKVDVYSVDQILDKRGIDVWNWQDPYINPQQKINWEQFKKEVFLSVYHFDLNRFVVLTDKELPELLIPENPDVAVAMSDVPYRVESTWTGQYQDMYLINLKSGARKKLASHLNGEFFGGQLSFNGRYVAYYKDNHWFLYNVRTGVSRNLTEKLPTPFHDVDDDHPCEPPNFGPSKWTENDHSVIIYDKYDIWEFPTETGDPLCLTAGEGRKNKITYRILTLDPEEKFYKKNQEFLLSGISEEEKYVGFYSAVEGKVGVTTLLQMPDRVFRLNQKAKKADKMLFTRENFQEFPDVWVSDLRLKSPEKISNLGAQTEKYLWGKSELIEWKSLDGARLQGVVIKPENYDPKKRYPVLIYYYEIFSNMLHFFVPISVSARPCLPMYTGNGYVVFLPDVKYEIGRPGLSATKCIVPGVQKLIDLGIADPKAIALHGHSWSGYQTAFVITQTNIFAAAIAGAAVTNMTSAYNGIRWESGIAREFQYEKNQSRIGKSLIEAPQLYIDNSPVFFADRINTPLLLEFGDKDGAVPWYQGIEMYLQMRRLKKNCILLQYNEEGHSPTKYPNKLDYAIKMKEYLDHYLKGAPAPDWIKKGVPYQQMAAQPASSSPMPPRPPRR
ncbi:MAG: prolyl oligopeptidase family serine peptidase [Candidatus Omnitrophota bacterium]